MRYEVSNYSTGAMKHMSQISRYYENIIVNTNSFGFSGNSSFDSFGFGSSRKSAGQGMNTGFGFSNMSMRFRY